MNLQGNATAPELRGKINSVYVLCIDAYAIAVKNGFEGTEEEWLASLAGNADRAEAASDKAEGFANSAEAAKAQAKQFAESAEEMCGCAVDYAIRAENAATQAEAAAKGRPWKQIADATLDDDGRIIVTSAKQFDEFDLQINTQDVPTENCLSGTLMMFWDNGSKASAFQGLMNAGLQYFLIRFHGILRNERWEVQAYSVTENWQAASNFLVASFMQNGNFCSTPISGVTVYPYDGNMKAGTKYKLFVKEVAE